MIFYDRLRPPPSFDPQAAAYKDWLHLNLFDHASGSVALVNLSLHGAPNDNRARGVGTALVHVPGAGWIGNLEICGLDQAAIGNCSIGLERTAIAVDYPLGNLTASVRDSENDLVARVTAQFAASPIIVEQQVPLGHGWISWYAMPWLDVRGEWTIGGARSSLSETSGYHDHNWGRWFWGDNLGWEWGCFHARGVPSHIGRGNLDPALPLAIVFSVTTDRAHRAKGQPSMSVYAGKTRREFRSQAIKMDYRGRLDVIERRVPGALAALHQDQAHAHLPSQVALRADDGHDCMTLEFTAHSAAQLITGDPIAHGYSFIHEIAGSFTAEGRIGKRAISGAGLGVFEFVC